MHEKLKEIYQAKLHEIKSIDPDSFKSRRIAVMGFKEELQKKAKLGLIAEIKKASPSKGVLRPDFDLEAIINDYNIFPADVVSILTDEKYFDGRKEYIKRFKSLSSIPVLRKDFIIDEVQVYESYHLGADIILLIVAMLSQDKLMQLFNLAKKLGMEVLVETHTKEEIVRALELGAEIIGINSRNLNTFEVDLNNVLNLVKHIPPHIIKIAESGIHTHEDILKIQEAGFNAVLIGEAFMVSGDLQKTYNRLFK
jgi:indole-3-glycerol phosphate synthase